MSLLAPYRWFDWLLGIDDRYRQTASLFLRVLALIYLAAFLSAAIEIVGLVGSDGILPVGDYLAHLQQRFGTAAWARFPTLFWLDHGDTWLLAASYAGCVVSVLLLLGWRPLLSTLVLYLLYLSLFRAGQTFFNFQWDYLLLETGFLAIFLTAGPNRLLVFLFHWLLFRLRFLSGLAKVMSGDPSWHDLTTLRYYFETQPLPHMGSWFAHQLPDGLLRVGTGYTLFVELVVPFFIFLPRPFRLFAAGATILIQVLILLTSNHNFVNLLTIALCLFLLDDQALRRLLPDWLLGRPHEANRALLTPLLPVVGVVLLVGGGYAGYQFVADGRDDNSWNAPIGWVQAWGLANVYHVFPTMQTERQELVIEGSNDGQYWQAYRFRYKPNDAFDRPRVAIPLHPHLDWMMWFIPPQNPAMRYWFDRFLWQLRRNSPAVTGLLEHNPFPDAGPRYLRVLAYRYRFTDAEEYARSGQVWHTELLGEFPRVPPRRP